MKTLDLITLGLSAFAAVLQAQDCPAGYSMSVSYITVMASMTPSPEPTTTVFSTSWTTKTETVIRSPTGQAVVAGGNTDPGAVANPVNAAAGSGSATPSSSNGDPSVSSSAAAAPSSASSTSPVTLGSSLIGQATFYGGNVAGGTCSFSSYTLPSNMLGTALSDANWDTAAHCGECITVKGPNGNNITAMIVDQCPGCGQNHLDLFQNAFADLANPSAGVIDTTWTPIACGITSPLSLHNKEGTSKFFFSMQVLNANLPVQSLEVSTDGGNTWQPTTRKDYNFFEQEQGFMTDTVDVKVMSTTGGSVVVNGVSVADGSSTTAGSNFS